MRITVSPRYVAAPWEQEKREGRSLWVGAEDHVVPEPGPVAAYRSVFPDRQVGWNRTHQLFEITQKDGVTGEESMIEWVFYWDAEPLPDGTERSSEEVADMVSKGGAGCVRRFSDFDYRFVERRLKERTEFLEKGALRYQRRIADRNHAKGLSVLKQHGNDMAAILGEGRRWLPAMAAGYAGARIPLIQAGIELKKKPA
jgi:hypothetical protein